MPKQIYKKLSYILLFLLISTTYASADRVIDAFTQFFDDSGNPLISGTLTFYEPGTTTDKDTYSDNSETTPNTNPVVLSSAGRCPDVFGSGSYKVVSKDSDGVTIQTFDPVGGTTGATPFADWNSLTTYSIGDEVTGSDGNYYRSLANSNQGNDPTSDSIKWEQIEFIDYYNANRTYSQYDRVRDSDGYIYTSLQASNLNKTPSTNQDYWQRPEVTKHVTKTAAYSITASDCLARNIVINNAGAGSEVIHPLPAAAIGYKIGFYCAGSEYLRVNANGTDVFATASRSSAAGGYVRNNTQGLFFWFECFEAGRWTLTDLNDILFYDE